MERVITYILNLLIYLNIGIFVRYSNSLVLMIIWEHETAYRHALTKTKRAWSADLRLR